MSLNNASSTIIGNPVRAELPKILFITKYFHPYIGGMEKQALTLAAALVAKGWHVKVITARINPAWPAEEEFQNISIVRLPSASIKFFGAALFLSHLAAYLFKKRHSFELIHTFQVGYTAFISIVAAKLLKKASVLKLACSGPGGDVLSNRKSLLGQVFLAGCKRADAIIALNEEIRHELATIGYPEKLIMSIPNCVDTRLYHPAENRTALRESMHMAGTKIILYTGRILFVQKRLDLLVRAVSKITCAQPIKLYILGDGPDARRLKSLCEELNLHDRICVLKNTGNIAPFLQAADLFVLPSEYEGISNSVLEAMATGLAVIATDITGNKTLLENDKTGMLIPCGDERKLISALQELIGDGEKAAVLGRQARAKVCLQYSLDKIIVMYTALYEQVLEKHASKKQSTMSRLI